MALLGGRQGIASERCDDIAAPSSDAEYGPGFTSGSVAGDVAEDPAPEPEYSPRIWDTSGPGIGDDRVNAGNDEVGKGLGILENRPLRWYSYLGTAEFWIVVGVGQILALCITATNTFSTFLQRANFNAPAFQTLFNYVVLAIGYNVLFLVRDGPRVWARVARREGWKYLIMAFLDVEGNYFTVLAYQYTNLLSAQLINFWAIVCVVLISFFFLKVRYRWTQIAGIVVCCGGMGILLASDHLTGSAAGQARNMLKGDLFALLGATLYGTSNVFEEWLVSKAPMYHVLSFIGLLGAIISGVQAAIFDRASIAAVQWSGSMAAWLVGFTVCLSLFYSLVPIILRMGSAAVFDVSLLTANFWGVIIGVRVFGYSIHFLYPIAFVCIVIGLVIYFLSGGILGDSRKPWLGENQEAGVAGVGTAKLRAIRAARVESGQMSSSTVSRMASWAARMKGKLAWKTPSEDHSGGGPAVGSRMDV